MMSRTTTPAASHGREVEVGHPAQRQDDQDLLGRVGHGGERVAGEDRQREALGQQRLTRPVAADRSAEDETFRELSEVGQAGHGGDGTDVVGTVPRAAAARPAREGDVGRSRRAWAGRAGCSFAPVRAADGVGATRPAGVLRARGRDGLRTRRLRHRPAGWRRSGTASRSSTRTPRPSAGWARSSPAARSPASASTGRPCSTPASTPPARSPRSAAATTPTSSARGWPARPSASSTSSPASTTPSGPRSTSAWASRASPPCRGR